MAGIAIDVTAPGAISNYEELCQMIWQWLDRDEADLSRVKVDGFLRLTEARLNRIMRHPRMEKIGMLLVDAEVTPLPLDFLELRTIYAESSPDNPLASMSPAAIKRQYRGTSGTPCAYCIEGLLLRVAPVGSALLEIGYYAKIPALSAETPTNWLLENYPDIYLFGALVLAETYIDNPDKIGQWKAAFDEAVSEAVSEGNKARWGAGPLVPLGAPAMRGVRC